MTSRLRAVSPAHRRLRTVSDHHSLWILALATFVVGDVASTSVALATLPVHEANPVAAQYVASGLPAMLGAKLVALTLACALHTVAPDSWKIGVPVGLSLLGTVVVANNLFVSTLATGVLT